MAQSEKPTFKKLTAIDIVNVSDLFKQYLTVTPNGAVYAEGWDDERVANEAIPSYVGNGRLVVGKYRITLGYGVLALVKKERPKNRLDELEDRIYYLETLMARYMDKAA
jgi:hypothetical protein